MNIPKTDDAAKPGRRGSETTDALKRQQMAFDLEKQRLELEKERSVLKADLERQRAETERDLMKEQVKQIRDEALQHRHDRDRHQDLLAKIVSFLRMKKDTEGRHRNSGYVAELIGYQAVKRISSEIIRNLNGAVGLGNEVRILITDQLDYARGDLPLIEVTSQFSVFEVRCRKQVAANKELSDEKLILEEKEEEKTGGAKAGTTRLGFLRSPGSSFFPDTTGISPSVRHGFPETAAPPKAEVMHDSAGDDNCGVITESLIASIGGLLRSDKRKVYVYNFYSMDTTGPQSKLMNMYAALADCSGRLCQSRNRLSYFISRGTARIADLQNQVTKTGLKVPESPDATGEKGRLIGEIDLESQWLDRAVPAVLASDAIHEEMGYFVKAVTGDQARTGSRLAKAVFREKVRELGITHLLYLKVISNGGETRTRHWFWGSGNSTHFGGAVVSYILSRVEGDILVSDTLPLLYSVEFDASGQRNSALRQIRLDRTEKK